MFRKLWLKLPVPVQGFLATALLFATVGLLGPYLISSGSTALALLGAVFVFLSLWLVVRLITWTFQDSFHST